MNGQLLVWRPLDTNTSASGGGDGGSGGANSANNNNSESAASAHREPARRHYIHFPAAATSREY